MAEAGIENTARKTSKTRGKTTVSGNDGSGVVPAFVPSEAINHDSDTIELVNIWQRLDDAGRADLLAVARGLSTKAVLP